MKLPQYFKQTLAISFAALFAACAYADGVNEPIPTYYQEAGLSRNRGYENQHANEHIDPFTGKLQWHYTDLFIPGNGGLDIAVQRSYSSVNDRITERSPYGVGWTMHYGRILRRAFIAICDPDQPSSRNAVLELPDGSRQTLHPAVNNLSFGGATFITKNFWRGKCNAQQNGLDMTSPDGTTYEMTTGGYQIGDPGSEQFTYYTSRIIDRNGNTLNFTYTTLSIPDILGSTGFAVKTITASDGRVVTFNYANGALDSITDGTRVWTYTLSKVPGYPDQFNLDEVKRPDGNSWKYQYNPPPSIPTSSTAGALSIKKVTYPTGGTFDYQYEFVNMAPGSLLPISTVVKTKVGDNATWTFNYKPATKGVVIGADGRFVYNVNPDAPNLEYDTTTVVGPEGTAFYMHMGYVSTSSGALYSMGTLLGKLNGYLDSDPGNAVYGQFNVMHAETNAWNSFLISNQLNVRQGTLAGDAKTYIPVLAQRKILQYGQTYVTTMSNYDAYANPQTITETGTDSRTTTLEYYTDPVKWVLRQKKSETVSTIPGSVARTFDANGNMLSESRYGLSTIFTYNAEGDVSSKQDARGNVTTYSSYYRGIPRSESQPEAVTVSRTVSLDGNVTSQTDGTASTTSYGYDSLNRVTSITHATGNPVSVTWGANSRRVTRGSYSQLSTFDGFGREIRVEHSGADTVTQTYAYDSMGKRKFASYPNSSIGTGYKYDMLGRPLAVYHDCSPSLQSYSSVRSMSYSGENTTIRNERGNAFTYTYRSYGSPDSQELMSIQSPDGAMDVTMSRNGLGQPTQVTQNGITRSYVYNASYQMTSMSDPEVGTTTYGRDANGNMISRQVGSSAATTFSYDGRNRVKTITYPSSTIAGSAGTPNATMTYYKDDKLQSSDNAVASRTYVYDENKNLTQETLTMTGQAPFVVKYAYSGNDALKEVTYSSGKLVRYAPDAFGRPTQASPYVNSVEHHSTGQVAAMSYANGAYTRTELNARQWPNALSFVKRDGTSISSANYAYDKLGNVTSINDGVDASYNRTLKYDSNDRLTNAAGSWGSGSIVYSGDGNIQSQQLGGMTLNYSYNGANRLTAITGSKSYTFSYDTYGNVSSNGTNTFTYNDASRMRCANCGQANEVSYDYDASNVRVRSTKGGVSTYYVYGLSGSLLTELTPGVRIKDYIYLHGKQVAVREKLLP
jgi:YD repeat-containing protein